MVNTYNQPNSSTMTASQYKANIEGGMAVLAEVAQSYAPHQRDDIPANMTVQVDAGSLFVAGNLVANARQNTGVITSPIANPRIDRVVIDAATGVVSVITGSEAASPAVPAITAGKLPCAQVLLSVGQASILNSHITDERTFLPVCSLPTDSIFRKNRLKNACFAVDQRINSATSRADDTYGIDCWYTLTQTAAIQVTQQNLQENGQPFNIRLTQNQAAAQRMGLAQIVEARDSQGDRGRPMALSARVRNSSGQPVRFAILEWTGTADSVISDVVLDWTSSTYTPSNFFLAANLAVTAVGSITPTANAWTDIHDLLGALGNSVNNQIVFFWTEGTAAQNVTLDIGLVQLEPGPVSTDFEYRPFGQELALCQRYLPAFDSGSTNDPVGVGQCSSATAGEIIYYFPVEARIAPTGIIVSDVTHFDISVAAGNDVAATNVVAGTASRWAAFIGFVVAAGLTAGHATTMSANTASASILFTGAEL